MSGYPEMDAVLAGESEGCIVQGDCEDAPPLFGAKGHEGVI